jgi:hypothetical protein
MKLGHLLTRSGLTYPEVFSKVCHDSFCQLGNSITLDNLLRGILFTRCIQFLLPSSYTDCLEIWVSQLRGALRDYSTLTCKQNWHYATFALLLFLIKVQGNQCLALFYLPQDSLCVFPATRCHDIIHGQVRRSEKHWNIAQIGSIK